MLFIFDLDDTLTHEGFDDIEGVFICDETIAVLSRLRGAGHTLAIASHNDRAIELLRKNGIHDFFDERLVQGYEHVDKRGHLNTILERTNMRVHECVYIDDLEVHVLNARALGMQGEVCCHLTGVTVEQIEKYL